MNVAAVQGHSIRRCYRCGQLGHIRATCRNNPGTVVGDAVMEALGSVALSREEGACVGGAEDECLL